MLFSSLSGDSLFDRPTQLKEGMKMKTIALPALMFVSVLLGTLGCGKGGCGQPDNSEILNEIKKQETEIQQINDKLNQRTSTSTVSGTTATGSSATP